MSMELILKLSSKELQRVLVLKEKIEVLQSELASLVGGGDAKNSSPNSASS